MLIRETDIDERLDILENVENGEMFLYDNKISRVRFHNKTVASIMQEKKMTNAVLVFEASGPRQRAEHIFKPIGVTLEKRNREISIDIFFDIPRELFDRLRAGIKL